MSDLGCGYQLVTSRQATEVSVGRDYVELRQGPCCCVPDAGYALGRENCRGVGACSNADLVQAGAGRPDAEWGC